METSGLDPREDEIIEIGAIKVDDGNREVERFQSLVRPTRDVPKSIFQMTGITKAELDLAPGMAEVMPAFLEFIQHTTITGHNIAFDIAFLESACDGLGYELSTESAGLDTLVLARCLEPAERDYRLTDIAKRNGIVHENAHRALQDADTTLQVLQMLSEKVFALPYTTLQQLAQLANLVSSAAGQWFMSQAERRYGQFGNELPQDCQSIRGLVFHKDEPVEDTDRPEPIEMSELSTRAGRLLQENGPLASVLPSFEVRPGQKRMVEAVSNALEGDEHLLVEAGTGTGKSLAYLIPAAFYAVANDARIMISTHTIALQEQIRSRDFPTLRKVLPFPVKLSVFKGRTHYVCMRKLYSDVGNLTFTSDPEEVITYMGLLTWLTETTQGDREELGLTGRGRDVWPRIQSETETCINKRCPFFKPCYYFRAKANAYDADLVVTNHSLIFSDLKADFRVLPFYDKLVVDEGHHLEEQATKHLGSESQLRQVQALFARIVRDNQRQGVLPELINRYQSGGSPDSQAIVAWFQDLLYQTGSLRAQVEETFTLLGELVPRGKNEYRLTRDIESTAGWQPFLNAVDKLAELWHNISDLLQRLDEAAEDEPDDDLSGRILDAVGFYPEIEKHIGLLQQAADFADAWVTWVEVRRLGQKSWTSLHRAPIDVAPLLEEKVFNTKSSVILTSATLSVNGSFDFVKEQLGLVNIERDGRLQEAIVDSPFDLSRQALLCVPKDVPDLAPLSDAEAATWLSDSLYQLAKASNGRVMALFTSHAMLRATSEALREPLKLAGFRTFAQGVDGNRNQLLNAFREHPESVLLGAQTFWEGIDLPGDQLRTLVIIRLPFAPPTHPVTVARHQRLEEQGKSSFRYSSLPQAVVRFRQGFGRLIRSTLDKGVVVVFDKRIVTARYGSSFYQSISGVRPYVDNEARIVSRISSFFHTS